MGLQKEKRMGDGSSEKWKFMGEDTENMKSGYKKSRSTALGPFREGQRALHKVSLRYWCP